MSEFINMGVLAGVGSVRPLMWQFFFSCSVFMLMVSSETGRALCGVHSKYLWGIWVH